MQNELPFNIRKTFKEIGYGALPVLTDTGAKLCMRIDRGMINTCIDKEIMLSYKCTILTAFL